MGSVLKWSIRPDICLAKAPLFGYFICEPWNGDGPWFGYASFLTSRARFVQGPLDGGFQTAEEAMAAVDAKVLRGAREVLERNRDAFLSDIREEGFATSGAEARWCEDMEDACPCCGGSGHRGDVAGTGGAAAVAAERRRQIEVEGWTPEHDDQHRDGEMAAAAACYCQPRHPAHYQIPPAGWPWDRDWWKPKTARENLVRAGALIAAEIERLDRAAIKQEGREDG